MSPGPEATIYAALRAAGPVPSDPVSLWYRLAYRLGRPPRWTHGAHWAVCARLCRLGDAIELPDGGLVARGLALPDQIAAAEAADLDLDTHPETDP